MGFLIDPPRRQAVSFKYNALRGFGEYLGLFWRNLSNHYARGATYTPPTATKRCTFYVLAYYANKRGKWEVGAGKKATKACKNHKRPLPLEMKQSLAVLMSDLESSPYAVNWPHFGKLRYRPGEFHCHLRSGRPIFVACWRVINDLRRIEVTYVGTHEGAPY